MTAVRGRDGQCRRQNPLWIGLEAAHIFPLAYGSYWDENKFGRWMTDSSSGSINSVQNGLLLRSDIHKSFNLFSFSINPDVWVIQYHSTTQWLIFVGYKIVFFLYDSDGDSGKCLHQQCFAKPGRLSEHLLR